MRTAGGRGTKTATEAGTAAVPAGGAGPETWLRHARDVTDPVLREAVLGLHPQARVVVGYHLGWWDAKGRPVSAGWGKAVRPALTLLAARAVGARPGTGGSSAAAVQLAHDSSLLHDDIIDQDGTRRHRPTAWRVFGIAGALLAGDAMLALAVSLVQADGRGTPAGAALNEAVQQFIGGQFEDIGFEERVEVSLTECTTMAARKTGALMGAACRLGALAGDADEPRAAGLDAFGRSLGLAFQHVDDLLGIWGDPETTGKPAGADLHARKKSLPVVAALGSGTPEGAELAALYARDPSLDETETLQHAADLVERAGGRRRSAGLARRHLSEALDHLNGTGLPASDTRPLRTLAEWLAGRDH
ncbi:polyprenyl synthetase family protein [Streptomyces sp. NEAU-W12]|uniref:polyprenyl synthetase family protein n=1 Tax=Streptomyces sp. NEAU-W12 TaxID=2994668 RepID=UPI00224B4DB8|nr:polyprenyl synthetase family protein [Streptomyces sp. NEAU-W12]MCX2926319.1 polyprenyl synthetase family protein [Streptomyces sp. NEAU-W12]